MNETDRNRALSVLRDSHAALMARLASIDEHAWGSRAGEMAWSVGDVVEHLAATERSSGKLLLTRLGIDPIQDPARPNESDLSGRDEDVWRWVADGTQQREAPEFVRPKGRYATREEAEDALSAARSDIIRFAEATTLDLRGRAAPHPALGLIDGVQWLLFLAAHTVRHTRQIERMLARTG
jgi:hypothetical protein